MRGWKRPAVIAGWLVLAAETVVMVFALSGHALAAGQSPPECVSVAVVYNSGNGPTAYARWCGTGSQGESPMLDQAGRLGPVIVDGGPLTPKACPKANPCVVLWPRSPVEGAGER